MEVLTTVGAIAATEAIKYLAKDMTSFMVEIVSTYVTDISYKELVDSEWAFEEYLSKVEDTYSKSKTILYKDEKKELASFFEPPFLRKKITSRDKEILIPSENIEGIFNRSDHSKVLLTGIGGMGKTILLKHLCVNAIETRYKIPIFISLRWFNDMSIGKEPLEELIYDRLRINGFTLDYKYFLYSLGGNKYVFLFDAYDEIASEKRSIITHKISDFTTQYAGNSFVMTSRPVEQIYCWDEYRILELYPMNKGQVNNLIRKLDFDDTTKGKFIDELNQGLYKKYERFASIPLTLSILFITYVENTTIPETLQDFYEMAFDTLLYRHDQMKEGYERVLKSKLNRHEFREIFIRFCFMTYFKDAYSFSEANLLECLSNVARGGRKTLDVYSYKEDLVDVTCMLVREGPEYVFLHRSFQEYFAAYYVAQIADEQQRKFCMRFIQSCSAKMVAYTMGTWTFPIDTKITDFMKMLYSIEPKRFDYIVLLPILQKIHDTFIASDNDLITTTSQFIRLVQDNDVPGNWAEAYYVVFYLFNGKSESRMTIGEYLILDCFYTGWVEYNASKGTRAINDIINNHPGLLCKYLVLNKISENEWFPVRSSYSNQIRNKDYLFDKFFEMIIFIKASLLKYDHLLSINQRKMDFEDMLDSFY